jgi:hypothetical protein
MVTPEAEETVWLQGFGVADPALRDVVRHRQQQ